MTPGPAGGFASTGTRNHPGHDQKSHGRKGGGQFAERVAGAVTGREALESVAYSPSSPAIDAALRGYGGGAGPRSTEINGGLRGKRELSPEAKSSIESMDQAMRESAGIQRDTVVFRAVPDAGPFGVGGDDLRSADLTGLTWRDKGFVSTGVEEWDGRGTMMRIVVPKGTAALSNLDRLDDDEIILDRGLTFRVVADHGPREGGRTSKMLDVEVVPE